MAGEAAFTLVDSTHFGEFNDPKRSKIVGKVGMPGAGDSGTPVTLVNHPVRYDGETAEIRLAPQRLGAQSEEVLAELGFAAAEIAALARDGVVGVAEP